MESIITNEQINEAMFLNKQENIKHGICISK